MNTDLKGKMVVMIPDSRSPCFSDSTKVVIRKLEKFSTANITSFFCIFRMSIVKLVPGLSGTWLGVKVSICLGSLIVLRHLVQFSEMLWMMLCKSSVKKAREKFSPAEMGVDIPS